MTETPTPVPSATPVVWSTPTPMQFTEATPEFNVGVIDGIGPNVAVEAVAAWQFAAPVYDAGITILIIIMVLAGFRNIMRRIKSL